MNNWKKFLTIAFCSSICLLEFKIVAQAITTETSIKPIPKYQLAQTPVGYCTVGNLTDSSLNVRDKPNGEVVGSVESGTVVALGVTDGSEGEDWTKIITPVEGYVSAKYLKDCQYKY